MLQTIEPDLENDRAIGPIDVGRGTYSGLSEFVTFLPTERIIIGRYCSIAPGVTIMSGGQHNSRLPSTWPFDNFLVGMGNPTRSYRKIDNTIIGADVWIGYGAHISNGAKVGHGAVIGSCAVVTADVPPYAVVVGNRGDIHKMRFDESTIKALLMIEWWKWDAEIIAARKEDFYTPVEAFVDKYTADQSTVRFLS